MNDAINDWYQCSMMMSSAKQWLGIAYLFCFLQCALCTNGFLIHFSIYGNVICELHSFPRPYELTLCMFHSIRNNTVNISHSQIIWLFSKLLSATTSNNLWWSYFDAFSRMDYISIFRYRFLITHAPWWLKPCSMHWKARYFTALHRSAG